MTGLLQGTLKAEAQLLAFRLTENIGSRSAA